MVERDRLVLFRWDLSLPGNMYPICPDAIRPIPSRHPGWFSPKSSHDLLSDSDRLLEDLVNVGLAEIVSWQPRFTSRMVSVCSSLCPL